MAQAAEEKMGIVLHLGRQGTKGMQPGAFSENVILESETIHATQTV
jgi:hypothetical protein